MEQTHWSPVLPRSELRKVEVERLVGQGYKGVNAGGAFGGAARRAHRERPLLRHVAERISETLNGKEVPEGERAQLAKAVVEIEARSDEIVEALERLIQERNSRVSFSGAETYFAPELIRKELQGVIQRLRQIPGAYALGYEIPATQDEAAIRDFIEALESLGKIQQVIVPRDQKVPAFLARELKRLKIQIRRVDLKQRIVFPGEQSAAGLVTSRVTLLQGLSPQWIPVVASGLEAIQDPQVKRLVIALQTAAALLLAYEIKDSSKKQDFLTSPSFQTFLFPPFEKPIFSRSENRYTINARAVEAYLDYRSRAALQSAA